MNDMNNPNGYNPTDTQPQNNSQPAENKIPTWSQTTSTSSAPPASGSGSYTWGAAPNSPNAYYGVIAPKPQKAKKRIGMKIAAGLLSCLLISSASIGGFAYLINQGYVDVHSAGDNGSAAFTINKVVRQEVTADNISTISQKTPQAIADQLIPSVVCIQTFEKEKENQAQFGGSNFFSNGNNNNTANSTLQPVGQGSGIIYTADGYIITNAHVVEGDYNLKVISHDGETYEAELIGIDTATDLAVIKVNASGVTFTPAEFGSSSDLQVADSVMAIGNPGGIALNSTVTMGYVSALNREVTTAEENAYALKYIQTDAAINPGNSGGALVNMYGQVIGINTAKISESGYEGLGFAIPIDDAQPIISDLMQYGYVKDRAMIGITYQYVDELTARFNGLSATGLFVYGLTTDNAKNSGLTWGDLITKIDGTEITSSSTVTGILAKKKPGDTVSLSIVRSSTSENLTIDVTLSENTGTSNTTGQ